MTDKEATVYIVDVGSTMGERNHGRSETNLDWALEYVWDRITTTVQTGRKTLYVGVIGLRTDETGNMLEDEAEFRNIKIYQDLDQLLMPGLRKLRSELVVNSASNADATSALIIAIQMIAEKCKALKYRRKIVLVTDGRAAMQVDDLSQITKKLIEDKIELTVLGVDFDDAEYGFKEEAKDPTKAENEALFKTLCEDCEGNFGTLAQAIEELQIPRVKTVKPTVSYKGLLTLGDNTQYDDALSIDVERYPKTMKASAPSASNFALKQGVEATQSTQTLSNGEGGDEDGLTSIRNARTYQVDDESAPGGKKDIVFDELSKGYTYGSTAVHIAESDRNVTQFETRPSLDILGFVAKNQYNRYLDMGRSHMIIAQRLNEKASMALSSLIHALFELDVYAVARLVVKENSKPSIILLTPYFGEAGEEFECLMEVTLPFAEDVRNFKFPPLDRVVTVSGKHLTVHRNLPSDELKDAMSDYVDSMDLSKFATDDNGDPVEYAPLNETYDPNLHRINQVVKHRAVFPNADIPPPREILTRYSQPPEKLVQKAKPALDRVIKAAEVKKVPLKAVGKGRRFGKKDAPTPLSDLDVAALLAQDPKRLGKRIDPKNAVPEFKQMLANIDNEKLIEEACKQLKFIIFDWVKHSVGGSKYGQAVEAIMVMREEVIELEAPAIFNEFLEELKQKIFGGDLGGDRREFWFKVRVAHRIRPILTSECHVSKWTEQEAIQFMRPPQ